MISFEQRLDYLHWAERMLSQKYDARQVTWLTSLSKDDSVRGVVLFSGFNTGSCEVTAIGHPGWITKDFAKAVAVYVWFQLELRRVTAIIAVGNKKSLDLAVQLGFQREGVLREWFPTGDAEILGLLRDECKFYRMLSAHSVSANTA